MMIDSKRLIELAQINQEKFGYFSLNILDFTVKDAEFEQTVKNLDASSKRKLSQLRNTRKKEEAKWNRYWKRGWDAWLEKGEGVDAVPAKLDEAAKNAWLKANEAARKVYPRGDATIDP